MHKTRALLIVVSLTGALMGDGNAKPADTQNECFEVLQSSNTSDVQRVVARLKEPAIMVEFRGSVAIPYYANPECGNRKGGAIECSTPCDPGGEATMVGNRRILHLTFRHYPLFGAGETALPPLGDNDQKYLTGKFKLVVVETRVCEAVFGDDSVLPALIEKGDFSPAVKSLEESLSETGFLTEMPDWLFDEKTEIAVKMFQRAEMVAETGKVDNRTASKLNLKKKQIGSSCN